METLKNFFVGLFVIVLTLIILTVGVILWPFVLGVGSVILFIAVIILAIIAAFFLVVLIGRLVRKGFKG